jgi:6-phosphogluconolactonase
MRARIEVSDDPAAVVADRLAAAAARGEHVALTGGQTPRRAYERAAALQPDWSRATLGWGDERCVPPEDERSNYGMARAALLDRLSVPPAAVNRIAGELGSEPGARRYEEELRAAFGDGLPTFGLLLLGLGPDGHCASLFPNAPSLEERERAVVGVESAGLPPLVPRVSLTLPALNAAREVIFLIAGKDKAQAVRDAFAADPDPAVPASLVQPAGDRSTVVLDPAAAAELPAAADPRGGPG